MADIDFITFLTKHSTGYARFLRLTGEALRSGKHNIHWKCAISTGPKKTPDNFKCINKTKLKNKNSSLRHGLIINNTLPKIVNRYVIISDVDIAITYKNWDDEIVRTLDAGCSCFGAENMERSREAMNFPNVPFLCFKKDIMEKIELDFTPVMEKGDIKEMVIKNEEEAKILGRKIGELVVFNTGSRLSRSFKKEGLTSRCLKAIPIISEQIQLKFKSPQEKKDIATDKIPIRNFSEFHYKGEVFITHVGRSRARSFRTAPVVNWLNRVKQYIKIRYNIDIP